MIADVFAWLVITMLVERPDAAGARPGLTRLPLPAIPETDDVLLQLFPALKAAARAPVGGEPRTVEGATPDDHPACSCDEDSHDLLPASTRPL